jgi:HPr kinase/phosphorylase
VAGSDGVDSRSIANPRIQKPGLALAGYLPYLRPGRVQILGASEYDYLQTLPESERVERLAGLVTEDVPLLISTKGRVPPPAVLERCDESGTPCVTTDARTSDVIAGVSAYLEEALAPRVRRHGVLVDVFSLGTLIIGDAGIGKSECALELVYRGHRLVADDIVVIRRTHDRGLLGGPHELLQNYLELRGVGIIDVRKHFGMTATSQSVQLSLVIQLMKLSQRSRELEQKWREQMMETPRPWTSTEDILGVPVPKYTMVVAPGRDISIMVETAVRKCLLAQRGVEDERDFLEAINRRALGEPLTADGADDA